MEERKATALSLWTLTILQARCLGEEGRGGGGKTREISPDTAVCVFSVLRSSKSLLRAHFFFSRQPP